MRAPLSSVITFVPLQTLSLLLCLHHSANLFPEYDEGVSFPTVVAVFFPCFTGILSGANRANSLRDPAKAIPVGTLVDPPDPHPHCRHHAYPHPGSNPYPIPFSAHALLYYSVTKNVTHNPLLTQTFVIYQLGQKSAPGRGFVILHLTRLSAKHFDSSKLHARLGQGSWDALQQALSKAVHGLCTVPSPALPVLRG